MNDNTRTAASRSQLFQLLALGFSHPLEDFHRVLADGSYRHALLQAATGADCAGTPDTLVTQGFAAFEADYIHLFQIGRRGRPLVPLTAGDHEAIAEGRGRPEFLLQYTGWYRHFGLRVDDSASANELPDHLVCQLEFVAWLAHLEDQAQDDPALRAGYQRAQRDFLERHLKPFLEVLCTRLQALTGEVSTLGFYRALGAGTLAATDDVQRQLNALLADSELAAENQPGRIDAVNLWG